MTPDTLDIRQDDLTGPEIAQLLAEHLQHMQSMTPLASMHALDLSGLRQPNITLWSAWLDGQLLGCGALKQLDPGHGEIKSMRTARAHLRKGVARAILMHIVQQARQRGYQRISLETGAKQQFVPAHRLYESMGFARCGPFAGYGDDPSSVFMTLVL